MERVIDERWAARIDELLTPARALLATSVFEILAAEGFEGSYPTVARFLRDRRGPRFRRSVTVSVPIETARGEECQFDWTDRRDWGRRWGLGELWCFDDDAAAAGPLADRVAVLATPTPPPQPRSVSPGAGR